MKEVDELAFWISRSLRLIVPNVRVMMGFHQVKEKYPDQLLMADISTLEEGLTAVEGVTCRTTPFGLYGLQSKG